MTRITFYTANGSPQPQRAMGEAKAALIGIFDGATIHKAEGIWRNPDGTIEAEESLTITVLAECTDHDAEWQAAHVAERLQEVFQQKEVIYSIESATFVRVPGPPKRPPSPEEVPIPKGFHLDEVVDGVEHWSDDSVPPRIIHQFPAKKPPFDYWKGVLIPPGL